MTEKGISGMTDGARKGGHDMVAQYLLPKWANIPFSIIAKIKLYQVHLQATHHFSARSE